MRFDQIQKFLEKIEESPQLLEEVRPMRLSDILLLARREGFEINNRDWKEYMQEKIRQASASAQLSDEQLEQVAAGGDLPPNILSIEPFC